MRVGHNYNNHLCKISGGYFIYMYGPFFQHQYGDTEYPLGLPVLRVSSNIASILARMIYRVDSNKFEDNILAP